MSEPSPEVSLPNGAPVRVLAWPRLPETIRVVAEPLADEIREDRRVRGAEAHSVDEEERLRTRVDQIIQQSMVDHRRFRLHQDQVFRMRNEDVFRAEVARATTALASQFHPLSELLYAGRRDMEEIQIINPRTWVIISGRQRFNIDPESLPAALSTGERLTTFFQERVINVPGVVGDGNISMSSPIVEATVGSIMRMAITRTPVLGGNASFSATLRIPSATRVRTLEEYVGQAVMPPGVAQFLTAAMQARLNIVIAGAGGAGKTTLLRVLCGMIPENEYVVTIEDSNELRLETDRGDGRDADGHPVFRPWHNWTTALLTVGHPDQQGSVTMRDLVRHTLRRRPDRIILGEARGAEAADLLDAMTTGHEGSLFSIHAKGAEDAVKRMHTCVLKSPEYHGNPALALELVHRAIDLVVHMRSQAAHQDVHSDLRLVSGMAFVGDTVPSVEPIYSRPDSGGRLERMLQLGDLPPRLRSLLGEFLPNGEIPAP
jgi:Flp pilus assembly CpaF family ATPase